MNEKKIYILIIIILILFVATLLALYINRTVQYNSIVGIYNKAASDIKGIENTVNDVTDENITTLDQHNGKIKELTQEIVNIKTNEKTDANKLRREMRSFRNHINKITEERDLYKSQIDKYKKEVFELKKRFRVID